MEEKFDINIHKFVPKHTKLTEEQIKEILSEFKVKIHQLPKILITDAAIVSLDAKAGDLIQIERNSPTIGKSLFYRRVIDG